MIDKQLYQKAYLQHQQWNAMEAADRLHTAQSRSPAQTWRQYVELVEFCSRLNSGQSDWQRTQKVATVTQYYTRVQQLEAWRKAHGKQA